MDYPVYKLPHAVLPYEVERSLPIPVVCNIYSYLRRNQSKTAAKIEFLQITINHKITARYELIKRRKELREAKKAHREAVIKQLDAIIKTLEAIVGNDGSRGSLG
jgi:L-lactate utilization protein LutB